MCVVGLWSDILRPKMNHAYPINPLFMVVLTKRIALCNTSNTSLTLDREKWTVSTLFYVFFCLQYSDHQETQKAISIHPARVYHNMLAVVLFSLVRSASMKHEVSWRNKTESHTVSVVNEQHCFQTAMTFLQFSPLDYLWIEPYIDFMIFTPFAHQ